MFDAYVWEGFSSFLLILLTFSNLLIGGGTSKKEEGKRLPGGKLKKKVSSYL